MNKKILKKEAVNILIMYWKALSGDVLNVDAYLYNEIKQAMGFMEFNPKPLTDVDYLLGLHLVLLERPELNKWMEHLYGIENLSDVKEVIIPNINCNEKALLISQCNKAISIGRLTKEVRAAKDVLQVIMKVNPCESFLPNIPSDASISKRVTHLNNTLDLLTSYIATILLLKVEGIKKYPFYGSMDTSIKVGPVHMVGPVTTLLDILDNPYGFLNGYYKHGIFLASAKIKDQSPILYPPWIVSIIQDMESVDVDQRNNDVYRNKVLDINKAMFNYLNSIS